MELQELTQLITIRDYTRDALNNAYAGIEKSALNELNGILILLDKKIVSLLQSEGFKDYIGYGDVKQAIQDVRKLNDIRSGLKK